MRIKVYLILLLLFVGFAGIAHALTAVEEAKLTNGDGDSYDRFGFRVAISGDRAIVGANGDNDLGPLAGAAYIFQRNGTEWSEAAKLTASDGQADDAFGLSVAIEGNMAAVGALSNDLGFHSGAVYIFQQSGGEWSEVAKLTASDGGINDLFGQSLAISQNTLIVGAQGNDDAGAAYIFRRTRAGWTEVAKLTASDRESGDNFGRTVAISRNVVLVGAQGDDDLGFLSGAAYIFQRTTSGWTEVAKLTASDGEANDFFGSSVAIHGGIAVVGTFANNGVGAAYVFQSTRGGWSEVVKLTASDGEMNDQFGNSLAQSRDIIVVGAQTDDDLGSNSGAAYIFQRTSNGWLEVAKLTASDGEANDIFGRSVGISGNTIIVGALDLDLRFGSAYIFNLQ